MELVLSFDVPRISFPSRFDAIPCKDDHDDPHSPVVNVEGVACELPNM